MDAQLKAQYAIHKAIASPHWLSDATHDTEDHLISWHHSIMEFIQDSKSKLNSSE